MTAHRRHPSTQGFEAHFIGDPISGGWCDLCALPSVWRLRVAIAHRWNPMLVMARGWFIYCDECGRPHFDKD